VAFRLRAWDARHALRLEPTIRNFDLFEPGRASRRQDVVAIFGDDAASLE